MATTAKISDLPSITTLYDQCRMMLDDGDTSNYKQATVAALRDYLVANVTPSITEISKTWMIGNVDTGVAVTGIDIDTILDTQSITVSQDATSGKVSFSVKLSGTTGNLLQLNGDGLFLTIDTTSYDTHIADTVTHVTEADKTNWNGILTKANEYTDTKIEGLSSAVTVLPVATLPTENISLTTIYLISASITDTNNIYTEYMYINGAWEIIGSANIDLSGYYTKSETDTKMTNITAEPYTSSEVTSIVDLIWAD